MFTVRRLIGALRAPDAKGSIEEAASTQHVLVMASSPAGKDVALAEPVTDQYSMGSAAKP